MSLQSLKGCAGTHNLERTRHKQRSHSCTDNLITFVSMQHGFNGVMPSQHNENQIDQKRNLNENVFSIYFVMETCLQKQTSCLRKVMPWRIRSQRHLCLVFCVCQSKYFRAVQPTGAS
ncbi:hypothetical protein ATANTOWER_021739 [Ataeniobius toweri]|uniref:Uncharacterized protein n=1 Tax=Ataeniobius toweri TaxID=208326 RepID=A0ABU7A337_9TELE|nr:hypothetical protein [Ataeniobius toweri]